MLLCLTIMAIDFMVYNMKSRIGTQGCEDLSGEKEYHMQKDLTWKRLCCIY